MVHCPDHEEAFNGVHAKLDAIYSALTGTVDGKPGLHMTIAEHERRITNIEATRQQARRSALTVFERVAAWGATAIIGWVVYQLSRGMHT